MKHFNDELKFNSTQYCVKCLFREHHEILPNNFENLKARLAQLLKESKSTFVSKL